MQWSKWDKGGYKSQNILEQSAKQPSCVTPLQDFSIFHSIRQARHLLAIALQPLNVVLVWYDLRFPKLQADLWDPMSTYENYPRYIPLHYPYQGSSWILRSGGIGIPGKTSGRKRLRFHDLRSVHSVNVSGYMIELYSFFGPGKLHPKNPNKNPGKFRSWRHCAKELPRIKQFIFHVCSVATMNNSWRHPWVCFKAAKAGGVSKTLSHVFRFCGHFHFRSCKQKTNI